MQAGAILMDGCASGRTGVASAASKQECARGRVYGHGAAEEPVEGAGGGAGPEAA